MSTLDLAAKLAVLDDARRRLETELERDEHWRALNRPVPASEATGPEREARDHRLRQALQNNPVFVAWRNVVEAATALRGEGAAADTDLDGLVEPAARDRAATAAPDAERGSLAKVLQQAPSTGSVSDDAIQDDEDEIADGLPPEIAALIRAEAGAVEERAESEQEMHAVGERAARAVDKLLAIPSVAPVAPEQLETARRADRLARELRGIRERRRVQAQAADEQTIITQASSVAPPAPEHPPASDGHDVDFLLNPAGAPWEPFDAANDPQEAMVTVARTPPPPHPAPAGPSREVFIERLRAEERVPPPLERTRRMSVQEEAEVTLVRPGEETVPTVAQAPPPSPPEPKSERPLRRLINVLKGK